MARCFGNLAATIESSCGDNTQYGYTGRAWIMSDGVTAQFQDGVINVVKSLRSSSSSSATAATAAYHCYEVALIDPFTGTSTVGITDNGRAQYQKTVQIRISARTPEEVNTKISPFLDSKKGHIILLETKDPSLDGGVRVFGAYDLCQLDLSQVTQNEYENGGDWVLTFTCVEPVADVFFQYGDVGSKQAMINFLTEKCG